eukprot:11219783-Lingulodinium_polyedra.AAC.1
MQARPATTRVCDTGRSSGGTWSHASPMSRGLRACARSLQRRTRFPGQRRCCASRLPPQGWLGPRAEGGAAERPGRGTAGVRNPGLPALALRTLTHLKAG